METTISLSFLNVCGLIFCVLSIFKIINNVLMAARIAYRRERPPAVFYSLSESAVNRHKWILTIVHMLLLVLVFYLPFNSTVQLMLYVLIPLRVLTLWESFRIAQKNR